MGDEPTGDERLNQNRSRGRPPSVTTQELVEALQTLLDFPEKNVAWTPEVAEKLDEVQENVRHRLEQAANDPNVPLAGDRRGQAYIWWLTDLNFYALERDADEE